MKFAIDKAYLLECFQKVINVPSPVGYYVELNPVLADMAAQLDCAMTFDNKGTGYITLEGEDNSRTVLLGAHVDTLGFMIRKVDGDGMIRVRVIGGMNLHSAESEFVTVHTRDGRAYSGTFLCQSHSTHAFGDCTTLDRKENTMMVLLDEPVKSKADVYALGIRPGDYISLDPRCCITPNGYVKSRFIDDKGAVACAFAMLKYLKDNGLRPKYRTILAFPHYEEVGLGGTFVPAEVSEYVAVDIGLIGPDLDGNERAVTICAKDAFTTYDYELTNRLIRYAEKADCPYAVDTFTRYSTDGAAAWKGGNDLRAAAFGMAVYGSHGMERTHIDGLCATTNLMLAYAMDI